MNKIAVEFLNRCFRPDETIAILLRVESGSPSSQRILPVARALMPRYLAWLGHENASGANIHISANPLRSGSRKRTKEDIGSIRHIYMDIDEDGDARLALLRNSDIVPMPTAIVTTSRGKYQVLWQVEGFDFMLQEQTLKLLAIAFGGDRACTDCNRVLRLPGFLNQKYSPAHLVTVEYPASCTWTPSDFRLDAIAISSRTMSFTRTAAPPGTKGTHSEQDWSWALDELARGKDADMLTRELALRRADKPNPLYYSQRTIDVASARLWLAQGIRIDDVVTMLEVRRRFEIPSGLCLARAREIAFTAQRMTMRRENA